MRRLVDSVILVLVAYTLLWPIVRGFSPVASETAAAGPNQWTIVGRYQDASSVRVMLREHTGERSYDLTCDADGTFRVALDSEPRVGALLEVRGADGSLLATRALLGEEDGGVLDLGVLE